MRRHAHPGAQIYQYSDLMLSNSTLLAPSGTNYIPLEHKILNIIECDHLQGKNSLYHI